MSNYKQIKPKPIHIYRGLAKFYYWLPAVCIFGCRSSHLLYTTQLAWYGNWILYWVDPYEMPYSLGYRRLITSAARINENVVLVTLKHTWSLHSLAEVKFTKIAPRSITRISFKYKCKYLMSKIKIHPCCDYQTCMNREMTNIWKHECQIQTRCSLYHSLQQRHKIHSLLNNNNNKKQLRSPQKRKEKRQLKNQIWNECLDMNEAPHSRREPMEWNYHDTRASFKSKHSFIVGFFVGVSFIFGNWVLQN